LEWPLLDYQLTAFDDYGGIAAYLHYFIKYDNMKVALNLLKELIISQIDQDFDNMNNIVYFKPNVIQNNDLIFNIKMDILSILNGLEPKYINYDIMGIRSFINNLKLEVKIFGMIFIRYLSKSNQSGIYLE